MVRADAGGVRVEGGALTLPGRRGGEQFLECIRRRNRRIETGDESLIVGIVQEEQPPVQQGVLRDLAISIEHDFHPSVTETRARAIDQCPSGEPGRYRKLYTVPRCPDTLSPDTLFTVFLGLLPVFLKKPSQFSALPSDPACRGQGGCCLKT